MSGERLPAAVARELAASLVAEIAAASPELLRLDGIGLDGALEQQLFFALRDGSVPRGGLPGRLGRAISDAGRLLAALGASLLWWRAPRIGPRPIVAMIAAPVHAAALLQIEGELQVIASETVAIVRVGRAAGAAVPHAVAPRLVELLHPRAIPPLLRYAGTVRARLGGATAGWSRMVTPARARELRQLATVELTRIALGATALASVVRHWQPRLLVAFDEVGTWARVLPAVGRRFGIATLDLPHAEAADAVAIHGAGYDRMAVYGSRAASVLAAAGIPRERIVEIGAPRFDALMAGGAAEMPVLRRRVVFAAQYLQGAMTRELLELSFFGARAAAEALAPAELVVVPHPVEQPGLAAGIVADNQPPPGVEISIAPAGDLHAALTGATLLVTGWSNSVLEAACLGVPAITVIPSGVAPVDFAAEGLAAAASDAAEAAVAARHLLDPAARDEAIARAQAALVDHLGPLDGRASERAARIMLTMAGRTDVEESR